MDFISTIQSRELPFLWRVAENYLDLGQKRYRVTTFSEKKLWVEREAPHQHWLKTACKITSYVTVVLPLIALIIRSSYRKSYSLQETLLSSLKQIELSEQDRERLVRVIEQCPHPEEKDPVEKRLLLSWIFKTSMQHLYRSYAVDLNKKIVITSEVAPDGFGDYYQALSTLSILEAAFPTSSFSLVAELKQESYQKEAEEVYKKRKIALTSSKTGQTPCYILNWNRLYATCGHPLDSKVQEANQKIQEASLILHIPFGESLLTKSSWRKRNHLAPLSIKPISFLEYGCGGNIVEKCQSRSQDPLVILEYNKALGLAPGELGIAIKKPSLSSDLSQLQDHSLQKLLNPEHALFFSYMNTRELLSLYAFASIAIISQNSSSSPIDIIAPISQLPEESFENLGIAKVELFKKGEFGMELVEEKQLQEEGKILRLINPFPLANQDVQLLIQNSQIFSGCTGDLSFSEMISFNKLPFYQLISHKARFFNSLCELAEKEFSDKPLIVRYFTLLAQLHTAIEEKQKEKIQELAFECGKLLASPDLASQVTSFDEYLQTHYAFNEVIVDFVARKLIHGNHQAIKMKEQELKEAFISGTKGLSTCFNELKHALKELAYC